MKPLRLLNRQPKPQRHLGVMRSDDVLSRVEAEYQAMPQRYAVVVDKPVPLLRRLLRRVCRLFS